MHTAILCEKEEMNIHINRLMSSALVQTCVDIMYYMYFSVLFHQPTHQVMLIRKMASLQDELPSLGAEELGHPLIAVCC